MNARRPVDNAELFRTIAERLGLETMITRSVSTTSHYLYVWKAQQEDTLFIRFAEHAPGSESQGPLADFDIGGYREAEGLRVSDLETAAIKTMADLAGKPDEGQKIISERGDRPHEANRREPRSEEYREERQTPRKDQYKPTRRKTRLPQSQRVTKPGDGHPRIQDRCERD